MTDMSTLQMETLDPLSSRWLYKTRFHPSGKLVAVFHQPPKIYNFAGLGNDFRKLKKTSKVHNLGFYLFFFHTGRI